MSLAVWLGDDRKCSAAVVGLDLLLRLSMAAFRLGARERFLMGTNVNTPSFQVPTPEFGHGARARVQGLDGH